MPEPTATAHQPPPAILAYQARLLERTSSMSMPRSPSLLSRSSSSASSTSASGTLYSTGKSNSGGTLAEDVDPVFTLGSGGEGKGLLKRGGQTGVGSVREKWEQRVKAAEAEFDSGNTTPTSTLGRAGSVRAGTPTFGTLSATSTGNGTPKELKRRTLPTMFAPPDSASPTDLSTTSTATPSTPPRPRRTLSVDSPLTTPTPLPSTPPPLSRTTTAPSPTSSSTPTQPPQFRSAYMAAKYAKQQSSSSTISAPPPSPSASSSASRAPHTLGIGRRAGRKLERIASGDGPDDDVVLEANEEKENRSPSPTKTGVGRLLESFSALEESSTSPSSAPSFGASRLGSARAARPPSPLKNVSSIASLRDAKTQHEDPSWRTNRFNTLPGSPSPKFGVSPKDAFLPASSIRPSSPGKELGRANTFSTPSSPRKDPPRFLPSSTPAAPSTPTKETRFLPTTPRRDTFPPPASPIKDTPRTPRRERTGTLDRDAGPALLPAVPPLSELTKEDDEVEVHGVPGRIRLSRNLPTLAQSGVESKAPQSPAKQGMFRYALWADRNRANIQAYEYLCHVGEAMEWIERAMGSELGLGVVDFEEGLRNGVVLAKLCIMWGAEGKVFEHPKLQWRHSDNVNIFLEYVRGIGLPENFIFEFTDLYEKKNMPKVIYCIHALSHLLARRGLAERMSNLLGRLEFSDDQLAATQKGLSGVAMPNFAGVGKELWKEMKEEVVEEETEEEIRERELAEAEDSIVMFQTWARGHTARRRYEDKINRLDRASRSTIVLQSMARGFLCRRRLSRHREAARTALGAFVPALQAHARGVLARRRWRARKQELDSKNVLVVIRGLQARARGLLVRRRAHEMSKSLDRILPNVVQVQAVLRGVLVRRRIREMLRRLDGFEQGTVLLQARVRGALVRRRWKTRQEERATPQVIHAVVSLQARARGILRRRRANQLTKEIGAILPSMIGLQSHLRGVLVRTRIREMLARLDDEEDVVVRLQAAARGALVRREHRRMMSSLRKAMPVVIGLQAKARACLARKARADMDKALANVQVVHAVSGLQAFARAALTRRRNQEQAKQLEFVAPDVVGLQSQARGVLARRAFGWWWHYLYQHQGEATHLQALCRGIIARRRFVQKMRYYRDNLQKVVKIQSLFRAKEQREQYRQLTMGQNVTVSTIKNFVHLLNDSEFDFGDEIELERLRKKVVEAIRENQQLETYVNELDVKIALVVQNVKSFEELIKARRWHGLDSGAHTSRAAVLAAHGDPFAGPNTLDISTKRKLELYQQLFYLLQTRGEYLGRLFFRMSRVEMPEKTKRVVERVTLTLFGYGQRREDYLMIKLFQHAIQEEVRAAPTIPDIVESHPMFLSISLQYVRLKQVSWIRDTLQPLIEEVVGQPAFNLETDPVMIYRAVINAEEMRSGVSSGKPVDVTFQEAALDPNTRAEWVRHLQMLRHYTELFLNAITASTRKMPYSIRCIAKSLLSELRVRFPGQSDEVYSAAIGRFIFYRYLNPAIVAPDTFDILPDTIGAAARRNLAEISKMLTQISTGMVFQEDVQALIPLNAFVGTAITQMLKWFLEVADVPNPEEQYHAHEFLDATEEPRSIIISPNEVYAVHALLAQNLEYLTKAHDDILRIIITELDGVPHLGSDELKEARDRSVTLDLTNRFADVQDPNAGEKAIWVHAKRGVLAVLRVQPAKDLMESLMAPVTDEHEAIWEDIVANEFPSDQLRNRRLRMLTMTASDSAYRLEDITTTSYRDVKAHAMFYLIELEKLGKLTRADGFQGILNAIAGDVRSKHLKRLQRRNELESMEEALKHLSERKKAFEDQINSYHSYIDSAMNTMQRGKGKKRFVMPFTKQYFHLRDLQRAGKNPQFGSYKYSAQELYDKGILLSVDKLSPRQFDRLSVVISSDQVGEFTIELLNNQYGASAMMGTTTLRMEDLLQSQFENRVSLPLFDGLAKVNLNLLLYQINKKFYV